MALQLKIMMQWREKEFYWNYILKKKKKIIAKFGVFLKARSMLVNKMDQRLFSVPEYKPMFIQLNSLNSPTQVATSKLPIGSNP